MDEISDENYGQLRQILEKQNGRSYSLGEAKEISNGLIDFYQVIAELDNGKESMADSTINT